MTKKQVRQKTRKVIADAAMNMRKNLEKVILSGAINLEDYEDNYILPYTIKLGKRFGLLREFRENAIPC